MVDLIRQNIFVTFILFDFFFLMIFNFSVPIPQKMTKDLHKQVYEA